MSGFAKKERSLVSEHVHSRLACCNQLFTFLNFNILVPMAVLTGQKN